MPPGYEPRVRVQTAGAAPALPAQTAIADGIAEIGGALSQVVDNNRQVEEQRAASEARIAQEQQRRDRSAFIADGAGRLAVVQGAIAEELDATRKQAKPGAPEWEQKSQAIVDARMSAFIETLGDDPEVTQRFTPLIANWGVQTLGRERTWAQGRKAEHEGNGIKAWVDQKLVDLQKTPDFAGLAAGFIEYDGLLNGLDMDATDRETLRLAGKQAMVASVLQAQVDGGATDAVRKALESDALDGLVGPKQRLSLLGEADAADQQKALAAERAASKAQEDARLAVDVVESVLVTGALPTAPQMAAARAGSALLPPDEQVDFKAIDVRVAVNRRTTGMAAQDIRRERDWLRQKVDSGRASQSEQMTLAALDKRLDAQEGREGDDIKALMGEGVPGRIAVVEQVQGQDAATRFALAERAQPGLGHVALLPAPSSRRMAIEGGEIRKSRPELVPEKEAKAAFRQNMGSVAALLGEQYDEKMNVAMDLYANHAARHNLTAFNPTLFWQYSNIAMGATKRGDGQYQGGLGTVNGQRVVLPDAVTQTEFRSAIARTDWSAARDGQRRAVPKALILSQYYPVLVDEGPAHSIYNLRDLTGKWLAQANGDPLPWRVANSVRR